MSDDLDDVMAELRAEYVAEAPERLAMLTSAIEAFGASGTNGDAVTRHGSCSRQAAATGHRPSTPHVPITSPPPLSRPVPDIITAFSHRPIRTWEPIDQQNHRFVDPGHSPSCRNYPPLHSQIMKSP